MRRVGILTVGRSDYGIYRPLLEAIDEAPDLSTELYVSGMHLSPAHGRTVQMVENDGRPIAALVDMLLANDSPEAVAKSMGMGTLGFAQAFASHRPDMLVVLGDRFETFAATAAALPFKIPVAHLHGGEATFGAFDEAFRHSITKMAHLHFAATQEYADRIVRMGEEPWRVHSVGALAMDNVRRLPVRSREELEADFGLDLSRPPLLCTFHPETLRYETVAEDCEALMEALHETGLPVVFSGANADTNGRLVNDRIKQYVAEHPQSRSVDNFGVVSYFSIMRLALAMVGNSSSGILEAPGFGLPVVNIGDRQAGRTRGANVVDCARDKASILAAIGQALSPEFREQAQSAPSPYGDGRSAERIVSVLRSAVLDDTLVVKRFFDGP